MKRAISTATLVLGLALTLTTQAAERAATSRPSPTTGPADRPTPAATTMPASAPAAVDPAVEELLGKMEKAGGTYRTLSANVTYMETEILFEDSTEFTGQVYYEVGTGGKRPGRFRIHFDRIKRGGVRTKEDRDYAFFTDKNGQWLVTRNARIKLQSEYQVAPPGSRINPLQLGKGPFPVPFGQKKADVLRLYKATAAKPPPGGPKGTRYLKLVPRDKTGGELKVRLIELWVSSDGLPVKIRTEDTEGLTEKVARFSKIKKDPKLPSKVFKLPPPPRDWEHNIEWLPKRGEARN